MKSHGLTIVLSLILMLAASAVFAQDGADFTSGQAQGKADADGNWLYGCGGFACGPFGVLAAALSKPQPDHFIVNNLMQSRGGDYAAGYTAGYTREAKKKNITYSAIGMAVSIGVSLIYYIAVPNAFPLYTPDDGAPISQKVPAAPVGICF